MSSIQSKPADRLTRRKVPQLAPGKNVARLPAWLVSIGFHIAILTTIATIWTSRSQGTGDDSGGPVGVAVVYETAAGSEYFLAGANSGGDAPSAAAAVESLPQPSALQGTQNNLLDGLLPSGGGPAGDTLAAAGSLGLGDGQAELGMGGKIPKVKTTVFGIEGEGTRFLYVFDRSDSMNGFEGLPLRTAKQELLTSLESLGPAHEFQIIFYNDSPLPFGGLNQRGPQLLRGDAASKEEAQRFVRNVGAIGGTQHIDALRMALAMAPDVVFFLTDADFPVPSSREMESIQANAARAGATIHAIPFGSGPNQSGGGWIRLLAEGTLGKYRYIDVTQL